MKIGQLYNTRSFQDFNAELERAKKAFADSYAGSVLERNLTAVDPTVFEKKYPELVMFNLGVSVDNSGGYAKRIQSLRVLEHGEFADAGDATTNKGKISLSGEDNEILVTEREAEISWTKTDVEQASLQNLNLLDRLMMAVDKAYKREVDETFFVGRGGNKGLLNNAEFSTTSASGAIGTLTADEMYDEISGLINAQNDAVANTPEYMVSKVVMPTTVLNALKSKILNSAGGASSVLEALKGNFPEVTFIASFRCNDVEGTSVVCAFNDSDSAMKMRIPEPLVIGETIKKGSFSAKADAKYRIAGLDILEATAGSLLTGL